jgi:hypothetical protein
MPQDVRKTKEEEKKTAKPKPKPKAEPKVKLLAKPTGLLMKAIVCTAGD